MKKSMIISAAPKKMSLSGSSVNLKINESAAIQDALTRKKDDTIIKIPVDLIEQNPANPRSICAKEFEVPDFGDRELTSLEKAQIKQAEDRLMEINNLAESINKLGMQSPLGASVKPGKTEKYILNYGHRRFYAIKHILKLKEVSVKLDDDGSTVSQIPMFHENYQRADLNPIQQLNEILQLQEELGDISSNELAKKLNCKRSYVAARLQLVSLPNEVKAMVENKLLTLNTARSAAKYFAKHKDDSETTQRIIQCCQQMAAEELRNMEEVKLRLRSAENSESTPEASIPKEKIEGLPEIKKRGKKVSRFLSSRGLKPRVKISDDGSGAVVLKFDDEESFKAIEDYLVKLQKLEKKVSKIE